MHAPHSEQVANVLKELIGDATETIAFVNGHACIALLDTGSQVTSISKSFYHRRIKFSTAGSVVQISALLELVGTKFHSLVTSQST